MKWLKTPLFVRMMILTISVLVISLHLTTALSELTNGPDREVNICTQDEEFRCPDGEVIAIQEVKCESRGRHCVTSFNQSLSDICQGHQTCSNLGLRDMFSSQCAHQKAGVRCRYRCVPGKTAQCHSNICAQNSQGLVCSPGSILYIRHVTCSNGDAGCAWSSYNLLTSLCEGSDRCDASGLRDLLSPHCDVVGGTKHQVLVDYLCVPDKLVHDSCTNSPGRLSRSGFGVITLPKSAKAKPNKQCKWEISYQDKKTTSISVFMVQQAADKHCNSDFLRIQYTDCKDKKAVSRSFCNLPQSSIHLMSCGPVTITSSSRAVRDLGRQFIISYQGFSDSDSESFLSSGLPTCIAPPAPVPTILTVPTKPEDISQKALHDPKSNNDDSDKSRTFGSFKLTLQMLLLYIFLGALILVLLVVLVTIIVRYRRMSIPRYKYGDSSENVMLWRRYDDTAMDIFQHNNLNDHHTISGSINSDTTPSSNQVIATVHRDAMIDHEEADHRMSMGSGISSFLPPKRDSGFKDLLETFQTGSFGSNANTAGADDSSDRKLKSVSKYDFYDLPEEVEKSDGYHPFHDKYDDTQFDGHYSNPNSLTRPQKTSGTHSDSEQHGMTTEDQQPLVYPEVYPKDDYHYCVNNDEYAIVDKSRKTATLERNGLGHKPQISNGYEHRNGSVNFQPTSGLYDNNSNVPSNSNHRKSRENAWRDEF